ncbi:tyrosine-protein phosphatase [Fibrobacter sp. UWB12]|uniref:tyrosine-protein phosphatase n=1 Tax=Fibrobacter sp. UWB12 TaxID=1896203 RepID=UPI00091D49AB|nr:tyrosine-protein phosphatase [Fibrobacter sp. UWB12]SHK63319.1 protein tyrosine phosphatase [Fibrobacter sp. UWB12]
MANILKFECIDNARQLGGILAGGRRVKHNKLFRSGNLSKATDHDLHRLRDEFGVHQVIDFRSDFEYMRKPDKLLDGMQSILIPVLDESMHGDAFNKEQVVPATGVDFMEFLFGIARHPIAKTLKDKLYNYFVESDYAHRQYRTFFETVLAQKGAPVLWHCTSGKDRCGFGAVLMLAALGADDNAILDDYAESENSYHKQLEAMSKKGRESGMTDEQLDILHFLVSVKREYMETPVKRINQEYGSLLNFIQKKIGVTQAQIESLRKYYLE